MSELPNAWETASIASICGRTRNRTLNPLDHPAEEFEYYSIPAFQEFGRPVVERGERILSQKMIVDNGTVLFGKLNPRVLKVWQVESDLPLRKIATTEFLPILPNERALADYVYFLCQSRIITQEAGRLVSGSTPSRERVDPNAFYQISFPLPPLPEQRAIAAALRAVQEARDARRRELAVERERKAALMEDLFTNGVNGEPLKETEIGPLPQSWSVATLGDVANVSSGGTPDRQNAAYWNGSIPWVKTGEINYGVIFDTDEKITELGLKNSSARIVPAGTLLMAMYGQGVTRGKVAILGIDASINQACAALWFDPKRIVTRFAFYHLARGYEALRNLGHGANQKNLNASHIRSFPIPLASLEEQAAIAEALTASDIKIEALDAESVLLDELFRAILDELLSGRLSSVPLIERNAVGAA